MIINRILSNSDPLKKYFKNYVGIVTGDNKQYLSKNVSERPYIFYVHPKTTSVDQYWFDRCVYSYYQITLGADGYFYRCSAVAAPDAIDHRLGMITSDLDNFNNIVVKNYNVNWSCKEKCFARGLRCNRMAIECNQEYQNTVNKKTII
jgi:hypothetical protein